MFVKQIDLRTALRLAADGIEIKAMCEIVPDGDWEDMLPTTLQKLLDGCLFFRAEPAMVNPEFEVAAQEMDAAILVPVNMRIDKDKPPLPTEPSSPAESDGAAALPAAGTTKPPGKCMAADTKRKPVDTGKLLALHRAGWTNTKIADEMGMNEKTVWYYINKARKETQNEGNNSNG